MIAPRQIVSSLFCKLVASIRSLGSVFYEGEIDLACLPLLADLHQHRRHQTKTRRLIGKQTGYARSTSHFLVQSLHAIGRSEQPTMALRKGKNTQSFGQVGFHPCGQLGSALLVLLDGSLEK